MVERKNIYVCLTKCAYGGWITMTAHLARYKQDKIYKLSKKRTEKHNRRFGYGVMYQNICFDDFNKMLNDKNNHIIITCIDKHFYWVLEELYERDQHYSFSIVIHDPTELTPKVLEFLDADNDLTLPVNIITIRKSVQTYLKDKHNLDSKFLLHPYVRMTDEEKYCEMSVNKFHTPFVSISRIDFDKHQEIMLNANKVAANKIDIYGACNSLYVYHKLKDLDFDKYYKGKFRKDYKELTTIMEGKKFLVDLSMIKNDGCGTQYTFLEAWDMGLIVVLSSAWFRYKKGGYFETMWEPGYNCYIVDTYNKDSKKYDNCTELVIFLNTKINENECDLMKYTNRRMLKKHIAENEKWYNLGNK
jgi:hypothetical protein